jgi:lipoprotein-releasing system permease protein
MYRTFLSWRYLRARRTNLIGITGIFVGVGALILILSIMAGFLDQSRKMIRGTLADLLIQPRTAAGQSPQATRQLLEAVRADPGVESACAQLAWYAILAREGREAIYTQFILSDLETSGLAFAELLGVDVGDELATTDLRTALAQARPGLRVADPERPFAPPPGYAPRGRPEPRVIVGEQLARVWNLERGDEIELLTGVPDADTGDIVQNNRKFVVAGAFRTGENEIDQHRVYLERAELADFLGGRTSLSQVLVKLYDYPRDGLAVRDRLDASLTAAGWTSGNPRDVRTWEQHREVLIGAIENEKTLMAIMLSLVLVVAGFTVFAILSMMVSEKRRDIGILTALGATPRGVMALFLLIGFWDALLGATLGAVAGTWAAFEIDPIERWLSRTFGVEIFRRDVYLFDHIPSVVSPHGVALIVLGAFLCTLVFAVWPAWKAARLDPLDALRYE